MGYAIVYIFLQLDSDVLTTLYIPNCGAWWVDKLVMVNI